MSEDMFVGQKKKQAVKIIKVHLYWDSKNASISLHSNWRLLYQILEIEIPLAESVKIVNLLCKIEIIWFSKKLPCFEILHVRGGWHVVDFRPRLKTFSCNICFGEKTAFAGLEFLINLTALACQLSGCQTFFL